MKKVIPSDVWETQLLKYYATDAPLPNLSCLKSTPLKKSPGPKRKKSLEEMSNRGKRKRMKHDGILGNDGKPKYTKVELLEILRAVYDVEWQPIPIPKLINFWVILLPHIMECF